MQSIPVFPDILKIAYFQWKNADVSKIQGACFKLTVPSFINVGYVWQILERDGLFAPTLPDPWVAPRKPILNRVKIYLLN